MRAWAVCLTFLAMAAAGCAPKPPILLVAPPPEEASAPDPNNWRDVSLAADAERIDRVDAAWREALADVRKTRFAKAVAKEGALLDPAAALPRALPPPGRYQCRVIKLGFAPVKRRRGPGYTVYPPYFCYVEQDGELTTLVKETGTERHAGRLWPDGDRRLIFLGALAIGGEAAPAYGDDPARDIAGLFERVAPFRWRLVIPWPRVETRLPVESRLDVLELVPFTEQMAVNPQ
jgi:hypothetical protein